MAESCNPAALGTYAGDEEPLVDAEAAVHAGSKYEAEVRATSDAKQQLTAKAAVQCTSVLCLAPGAMAPTKNSYTNLTPWVKSLFFVHTYYAYIYVFYMFVLAFYKGYALEYPDARRGLEMTLIMMIPGMQHLRFYFGYWGCELGMKSDLCIFLLLCSGCMLLLMYFLFMQAYILPLDTTFLFVATLLVAVEGVCGIINVLQTAKVQSSHWTQLFLVTFSIFLLLAVDGAFIVRQMLPHEAVVQETRFTQPVPWPQSIL